MKCLDKQSNFNKYFSEASICCISKHTAQKRFKDVDFKACTSKANKLAKRSMDK